MRRLIAVLCVLATLGLGVPESSAQQSPFIKGVNVEFHGYDATDPLALSLLLDQLQLTNVNSLLITIPVYMDSWDASSVNILHEGNDIHQYADSPTIEELLVLIGLAQERGMSVWLRPLINEGMIVETGPEGAWRGTIQPENPKSFFSSYEAMLQYYAATPGISWLVIGSELNSLELDPAESDSPDGQDFEAYWAGMISHLKQATLGTGLQLTYAQNWDVGMYQGFPAWFTILDAVSVDAYFPIEGLGNDATADQIAAGLTQWYDELEALKQQSPQRKLFFTEVGLSSQLTEPSVLERPWTHVDEANPIGLELQASYTAGSCQAFRYATDWAGNPLVDGMFWWSTKVGSVAPDAQPLLDRGFEVIGKPAQQVIAQCYLE